MEPIYTKYANTIYDSDEEHIQALHVCTHKEEGVVMLSSFWKPSAEELILLNNGSAVMLSILDDKHPAVRIAVTLDNLAAD